ncbi:hypothetical protein JCGZ_10167 [Jatropha curcas]|uniref:DUF7950 domain-containing protein n=1 Tax=Jatropha curcas TaxID=180498 RepID=A0A067LD67_JATCU|nr:uncharacterized protein LOC105633066 [Jatropha curcas]KDP46327.1 hypothetical protein JCGZ_10167 [Jatropha curcas]
MDGGDGWRVIACAAGAQEKTIINRIMLRFRPIAPKPAFDGSGAGGWKPENKNGVVSGVRTKRKYVRVKKNNDNDYYKRRRKKKSTDLEKAVKEDDQNEKIFTRQLLPERTDLTPDLSQARGSCSSFDLTVRKDSMQEKTDPLVSFDLSKQVHDGDLGLRVSVPDRTAVMPEKRTTETWVMVESVTDTCMDLVEGLGRTDVEKIKNLERDTCPGFISDGSNRVQWVNEAYKKMVTVGSEYNSRGQSSSPEITVRLAIKEKVLPYLHCNAFTCWVRLQYAWQKENYSQMVPCDVWKTECGGFAWRLDVKAALSLGL